MKTTQTRYVDKSLSVIFVEGVDFRLNDDNSDGNDSR